MEDSDEYAVYVYKSAEGHLCGWIGVHILRCVEMDKCGEISGLVVDENYRSRGIGRILLQVAEAWARSRNCGAILVHANVKRERAHRFYQQSGYAWAKTQEMFRKEL